MRSGIRAALFFLAATILHASLSWAEETVAGPVDLSALTWSVQPNGVSIAVFLGNPREPGPYGVRAKIPGRPKIAGSTHKSS